VSTALLTLLRLAESEPEFAIGLALDANIGTDERLADELCMALNGIAEHFTDDHVRLLLNKLRPVTQLEYWASQILRALSPTHREDILDFLLDRASAGGDVQSLSFHDYAIDVLGGAHEDELLGLLRRVRDAALAADDRLQWEVGDLFWRLTNDLDAALAVLLEWLVGDDEQQVDAALVLAKDMPWSTVLARPSFVEQALTAAQSRGTESFHKVRRALFSTAVLSGSHNRTMGQPSPRDVQLRDQGRECAERFAAGSPERRFFEDVVAQAEKNIEESALEDEEYPEG
jgi:hypothetical protein